MLGHDQLIPEETQEQYQVLIENLNRYYGTRDEDKASLARIRSRLLQNTAVSLPVADDERINQFPLPLQALPKKNAQTNAVRPFVKSRSRHSYLNSLAAAALLLVLVSSFVVVLHLRQKTATSPRLPAIAHGWSLVATFHGTGTRTITRQDIELGNKSGWSLTCSATPSTAISVLFNGNVETGGTTECSGTPPSPLAPDMTRTSPVALAPIYTIKVVTVASVSWQLMLFKGTYYPPLSIDTTNWHTLLDETDGTGNWASSVDITLPKVSALQYICHGTGDFKISLQPASQSNTTGLTATSGHCDGQPHFDVSATAGPSTTIQQVQITTGADNDWQVVLLGCVNGKPDCGITTTTNVSTSML